MSKLYACADKITRDGALAMNNLRGSEYSCLSLSLKNINTMKRTNEVIEHTFLNKSLQEKPKVSKPSLLKIPFDEDGIGAQNG